MGPRDCRPGADNSDGRLPRRQVPLKQMLQRSRSSIARRSNDPSVDTLCAEKPLEAVSFTPTPIGMRTFATSPSRSE